MSTEGMKAVVRRYYEECLDGRRFEIIREIATDPLVYHYPSSHANSLSADDWQELVAYWLRAFPDYKHHIDDLLAEGDRVAVRATFRATHKGEFGGAAATGKEVTTSIINIFRLLGDKIVEIWEEFDNLGLQQQIGAVPPGEG